MSKALLLQRNSQRCGHALCVVFILFSDVFRIMHNEGSQHFLVHANPKLAKLVHASGCSWLSDFVAGLDFNAESKVK